MATNLVPSDTNGFGFDAFLRDRVAGTTEMVSLGPGGVQAAGESVLGAVSDDGRYVAFGTDAANLVAGDLNALPDVFVRDRQNGSTQLVSVDSAGAQTVGGPCESAAMTPDGRFVGFTSRATNLVPGDTNGFQDDFVHDRWASGFTSLCDPGVDGVIPCPCSNPPGGPGRGCDNSSATGGAILTASGVAYLATDSLVFTTSGQRPNALSILGQWAGGHATGLVFGMGVRCTSGSFEALFARKAIAGSLTVPDFAAGDPTVSARSAAKGDTILPGQSRWYVVYYRDPNVLGGCLPTSTINSTQTGRVTWWP